MAGFPHVGGGDDKYNIVANEPPAETYRKRTAWTTLYWQLMTPVSKNPSPFSSSRINLNTILRTALILVAYIIIFTFLDWLTRGFQVFPNVVPWYPPHGISFALLLALGWRFAPALAITSLISSFFVYKVSLPIELVIGWAILVSVTYGVTAVFLRRRIRFDPQLGSMRDILWLTLSSAVVSAILSVVAVSGDTSSGAISLTDKIAAMFVWWIGETVGVLVVTPFLLIYVMPWVKQFADGNLDLSRKQKSFPRPPKNMIGRVITLLVVLYLAFGVPALKPFQPLYLIAIPLIWISLDYGIKGASAGNMIVSFGTIFAIWLFHPDLAQLSAVQLLMLILSVASLLMGAVRIEQMQAGKESSKSEKHFRALVEHSLEEISLVSADGTLIFESPTTRRPLGYPPGSFVGGNLFELFHPDDRAAAIQLLEQVVGQPGGYEEALFRLRHMDGSWRWMEGVVTNLLDEPAVRAVVINYRDVTERKQAEETLRASEDRYRDLVNSSQDLICTHDLEGRILSVNPFAEQMLGYPTDTLLQMNLRDILTPETQNYFGRYLSNIRKHGIAEGTMIVQTTKGERRIWEYRNTLRTKGVTTPIVRGMARDITETKQAEKALRESDKRLRSLFENTPVSIWEEDFSQVKTYLESLKNIYGTDLESYLADHPEVVSECAKLVKIIDVNRASMQLHGAKNKTELLENLEKTFTTESYDTFRQELIAIGKGDDHLEVDAVVQTLDGQRRNVTVNWAVAKGYEKSLSRVLLSLTDITGRKQAEEEIRTRTDELLALYALSRAMAEANDIEEILELVNRHAVQGIHTTFARIALLEGDNFVTRAAYPVRVLDQELPVGNRVPVSALPHCQRAMEQNEPLVLRASDSELSSGERAALLLDFAQSICLVPLQSRGHEAKSKQALGLLMLGEARSERREPFSPVKIRLAQSMADQTAIAIRRMLLQEQTERRLQHLKALREIDQAITSSFGLHLSMSTVLTQVIDQLHVDAAAVWLFNPASDLLEYSVGRGFRSEAFEQAKPLRLGEGYAGRAALERRTIHIANLAAQQDNPRLMRVLAGEEFVSYYGVPLMAREGVKGVLEVFHRTTLEPDEEWLDFLNTLAGQAAIAIDNATLFDNLLRSNYQLTQAYDATIEGWSAALDLRDKETEGHTQRVTELTVRLAKGMAFSKQDLVHVRRGALLHDIGKMGVPDRILLKPDKLTDAEWVIMRQHPEFAYNMLSPIHYLQDALDIPYCHHEKWDGTGYPRGLKGEQIPLPARLFAIVDVWDALTSDRPYRAAWSREETLEYILTLKGSHFDPQVVEKFLGLLGEDN